MGGVEDVIILLPKISKMEDRKVYLPVIRKILNRYNTPNL
jgi:hypothetical protein